jgi:hypothetical protein
MTSTHALAATVGIDPAELSDYVYQPSKFYRPRIYAIDSRYFCTGKSKPAAGLHLAELSWTPTRDQFWAKKANTTIWEASTQ